MPPVNIRTLYALPNDKPKQLASHAIMLCDNFSSYLALINDKEIIQIQTLEHNSSDSHNFSEDDFNSFSSVLQEFTNFTVLYNAPKDTLIPTQSFDKSLAEKYIKFNFQSIDNETVLFDDIKNLDIVQVYTIKNPFLQFFNAKYPHCIIRNRKSALIEQVYQHAAQNEHVYINTNNNSFDCIVIREKKLIFANTFTFNTAQNYIFYLMHTLKTLALNPETIQLYLSGSIESDSAIYNYIYKYVRHIQFIEKPEHIAYKSDDLPFHYFYNLLIL